MLIFGNLFSVSKPSFLIGSILTGITTISTFTLPSNINLLSSTEYHYFSQLKLIPFYQKNDKGNKTSSIEHNDSKIEGKRFDFKDSSKLKQAVDDTVYRLNSYYKKYNSEKTVVNYSVLEDKAKTSEDINVPSFYVHTKSHEKDKNLSNLWFQNAKFHQLSIDRFGYEYDDNAKSKGEPKLFELVSWFDIGLSEMKFRKADNLIEFNIFKTISDKEVKILVNEDNTKYLVDSNSHDEITNDWFIWLDKDLLTVKLNYYFQTHVFNQKEARREQAIKALIGDTTEENNSSDNGTQTEEQKKVDEAMKENYKNMSESEKEFASSYIELFLNNVGWTDIVDRALDPSKLLKSEDLNKIYNKFRSQQKSVALFENHLINVLKTGDKKSLETFLNIDIKNPRSINALNSYNESNKKYNALNITVDKSINFFLNTSELYDWIKNYSVRYFKFNMHKTNDEVTNKLLPTLSIYSSTLNEREEVISAFYIENQKKYSF